MLTTVFDNVIDDIYSKEERFCQLKMKGQTRPRLFDEFIEGRHKLRRPAGRWLAGCAARSGVSWLSVGWPTLRSINEKQEFDLLSSICSAYTVLDGV